MLKAKVILFHTNGNQQYLEGDTRPVADEAQLKQLIAAGLVEGELPKGDEANNRDIKPLSVEARQEQKTQIEEAQREIDMAGKLDRGEISNIGNLSIAQEPASTTDEQAKAQLEDAKGKAVKTGSVTDQTKKK